MEQEHDGLERARGEAEDVAPRDVPASSGEAAPARLEGPVTSPLPLHRVAGRAAALGVVAGLVVAVVIVVQVALQEAGSPPKVPILLVVSWLSAGAALALLVAAEEVARRARPALRLAAIVATGATTAAVITVVAVWVLAILGGSGPEAALSALVDAARKIARDPKEPLAFAACALLDALAIGASRLGAWPLRPGWIPRLHVQALLSALAGAAGFGLCCALLSVPSASKFTFILVLFMTMPASASVGLALGERVEARLLALVRRLREPAD